MKKVKQCWLYLNLRASFKILKIAVAVAVDWDKPVNIHIRGHNILQDPNFEIGTFLCHKNLFFDPLCELCFIIAKKENLPDNWCTLCTEKDVWLV